MIELKNISKSFGNLKAVDNVSFKVEKGETLILLGTSGCGKTTTLKIINRLIKSDSGTVLINQEDTTQVNEEKLRLGIGYVLQNHGLFPHFTIAENIAIVPKLLKWSAEKIQKRTDELLTKLALPLNIKQNYPNQLSGGQQQRVGLARALMANPPILLMDEPLGALDPITRNQIRKEFLTLDELQNKTIVMVTHDVQEAFELGDRICLMNEGKILQIGTPLELLEKPSNKKVTAFFEGQRLQLSLKTMSLDLLWDYFPVIEINQTHAYSAKNHSVWSALESLANQSSLTINHLGKNKTINSAQIMEALAQYKTQQYGTAE